VKVILFGATGMIGTGALLECLDDARVTQVLAVVRSTTGRTHPKLRELIRKDFLSYDDVRGELAGYDACFFCLGVSSVGMDEASYTRLTYDITIATAKALLAENPKIVFCYISGQGADSTEQGGAMWARVKGRTENELLRMPLNAYMLRPGYIQPLKGIRSKTGWYQAFYSVMRPLYPMLRRIASGSVTNTTNVGKAMIELAASGAPTRILGNAEINALAEGG
jgi:hypothetical protein